MPYCQQLKAPFLHLASSSTQSHHICVMTSLPHPCTCHLSCSAPLSRYGSVATPAAPELDALLSAAETSGGVVSLQQLQALFSFRLDDFQAQAVEVLLQGKSVVVCAPTGGEAWVGAVPAGPKQYKDGTRVRYIAAVAAYVQCSWLSPRLVTRSGSRRLPSGRVRSPPTGARYLPGASWARSYQLGHA